MHRTRTAIYWFLLSSFFFFPLSCSPTPAPSLRTSLFLYRFDISSFIEYSTDYKSLHAIPFSIPPDCGLNNIFPAPVGRYLLIELNCPNGQTVLFLDTSTSLSAGSETGSTTQPITNTDAHFLAWMFDGNAVYLKVDSLSNPHIIRAAVDGSQEFIPITEFTYDLAVRPNSREFTFTFSRGLGYGSELWLAKRDGKVVELIYADKFNYISFARFSPDGEQIAFIKIPDTQTPFTVGELWVMNADSSNPRKLADADAGHGYAANWSPDGTRIAFVARENPLDENANRSGDALLSNIYIVDVKSGKVTQITHLESGYVETPHWSPDGNLLAFSGVVDGRMSVFIAEMASGEIRQIETESACCPAWMRK
jgi:WD40 repeat protein